MNCKFCQHPLEEGNSVCPGCGKDNAEAIVTEEIPTVVAGFSAWSSGLALESTTQAHIELFNLYYLLSKGPLTVLAGYLATLPVFLWLTPYLHVSRAAFYEFRMQQQFQQAPEL